MAEINRHIQHVKSKVVENGKPKLPTESQLLDGEIAVNYAKDYETLSIKNESGDIVTFSSDNVFVEKYIEPNERVIAEALNDLNSRVGSISTDLDGKVDKVEGKGLSTEDYTTAEKTKLSGIEAEANKTVVDTALSETSENPVQNKAIYAVIKDNEEIVAEALNDLNSRVDGLNNVEASEMNGNIKINDDETTVYELPTATSSVLGGVMVDAALNEQSNNVVANSAITKAIVDNEHVISEALNDLEEKIDTHTADTEIHVTSADKTKLANIEEGATKIEVVTGNGLTFNDSTKELSLVVDTALSSASTNVVSNKAIYDVIKENEEITANALNDLDSRLATVSGDVEDNEEITANALNDLNSRVDTVSGSLETHTADTSVHLTSAEKTKLGDITKVEASTTNGYIKIDGTNTKVYELPTATSSVLGGVMVDATLSETSENPVQNKAVTAVILENERVISEALTDLNDRIDTHTADTQLHFTTEEKTKLANIESGATKVTVDQALTSASTNAISSKAVFDVIKDNEEIIANALTDLDSRLATVSGDVIDNEQTTATALTDLDSRADALETTVNNLSYLEEVTYSGLVSLKANSGLTKGMLYRITDYVTTTTQSLTQSANHPFDVIVLATSESSLNENAWAIQHDGDTYFSTSNLNAWEIKYCLENDTNRFAWADTTNGKGVIFYMKDEYNNECPYDFKNIMFNRSNTTIGDYTLNGNYYTFSFSGQTIQDASIVCQTIGDGGYSGAERVIGLHDNSVGITTALDMLIDNPNVGNRLMFALGRNIFVSVNTTSGQVFYGLYGNRLGCGCHDNVLLEIGTEATVNNILGNGCYGNLFDRNCQNNILDTYCYNNNFIYGSSNISLGVNCITNTFNGNTNVTLGNNCSSISLASGCENITIGNSCSNITVSKNASKNIIVENGNSNITINTSESTLKNITILQGCSNKTIAHSGTVPTTYRLSGSTMTEI